MSNTLLCPYRNEICEYLLVTNCGKMIGVCVSQRAANCTGTTKLVKCRCPRAWLGYKLVSETLL